MSDQAARLQATIAELEAELRDVDKLDPDTRKMLDLALEELHAKLHQRTSPGTAEPHSLTERLRLSAAEFEAEHPALASLLHRMVDALTQLGI